MQISGSVALVTGANRVFDAVEAGQIEVLADERSRDIKAKLSRRPRAHLPAHPGILGRRGQRDQLTRDQGR